MTKFILANNGSYENKGCEAIVRGTAIILDKYFGGQTNYCLQSAFDAYAIYEAQKFHEYNDKIKHVYRYKRRKTFGFEEISFYIDYFLAQKKHFCGFYNEKYTECIYRDIFRELDHAKAVLSIGGDNYSGDYLVPKTYIDFDRYILKHTDIPLVYWGCSLGPFTKMPKIENFMKNHLKSVSAILAREDNTVEYLESIGITENVYRVSDPAFVMEPQKPKNIEYLINLEDSIGINLSPLIAKYWVNGNLEKWLDFSTDLIKNISKKFDVPIYLIPHVLTNKSNDYLFLKQIQEALPNKNIYLLKPNYSAEESKYIISRLKCFLGARTHSTIAAFSTGVPTACLVYSLKGYGISREIYGNTNLCVDKANFSIEFIIEILDSLINNNQNLRKQICSTIPYIKERAYSAGEIVRNKL